MSKGKIWIFLLISSLALLLVSHLGCGLIPEAPPGTVTGTVTEEIHYDENWVSTLKVMSVTITEGGGSIVAKDIPTVTSADGTRSVGAGSLIKGTLTVRERSGWLGAYITGGSGDLIATQKDKDGNTIADVKIGWY